MDEIQEVLEFWFGDEARAHWFSPTLAFDQLIRKRFAELYARAATGDLSSWERSAEGCLALCILLDQMPRNMFRGDRRAFATDAKALAVADRALARRYDEELPLDRRQFLYMPFMHSENLANQLRALALFESQGLAEGRRYAEQHLQIIRHFGRFPHRNAILGRQSTPAEEAFLKEQLDQFGQEAPRDVLTGRRSGDQAEHSDAAPESEGPKSAAETGQSAETGKAEAPEKGEKEALVKPLSR